MKNFVRDLLLSFLSVIIFLLILEGFLRVTHLFNARISWSVPDAVLGWRMDPSREYWSFEENTHPIRWRTNQFGWKDKEWTLKKPSDTYRVAVLGDSYVEALQVEPNKNFVSLTEKQLASLSNTHFELMNFGRSAFTQTEELWILKNEVSQFSPDLVILFFFPINDIDDVAKETALDPIRPFYHPSQDKGLVMDTDFKNTPSFKLKSIISGIKRHSVLISFLTERLTIYQHQASAKNTLDKQKNQLQQNRLHGYLSLCTQNPDPAYVQNYNLNKRLILEIAAYLKAKGIPLMLVTIDIPSYIPDVEKKYKDRDSSFDSAFFEKDLRAFAESNGIEYLGLQTIFREAYLKNKASLHWEHFSPNDAETLWEYGGHTGHWNYTGHEIVSRVLEEKIRSLTTDKPASQQSVLSSTEKES